jgi:hypothetical protein
MCRRNERAEPKSGKRMKNYSAAKTASAWALIVTLAACGKQTVGAEGPAQSLSGPAAGAGLSIAAGKATVLGALNESDWYMVVSAQDNTKKPLVIWTKSKSACDQNMAEFSLKTIDPTSQVEPPQAWCMIGRDVRSKLGA